MRNLPTGLLLLLALSARAFAEDAPPPPPPPPWTGEVSAGLVNTSGNTKSQSFNAKAEAVYQSRFWRNTSAATALHSAQTDPVTGLKHGTAERYTAANKTDYNFTPRDYAFFALEYDKDLFGPIARQSSETLGYGRKILLGPTHTLEAEIGAGARQSTTQANLTVVPPVLSADSSDAIGRARVAYKYNISANSYLGETARVESGKSNTFTESVTEFKMTLVGQLFSVVSYTFRNNTQTPVGSSRTDTITSINLGWSFGK